MSSPSAPVPAPATSSGLARTFTSSFDSRVAHFNRAFSSAAGIDSTLCFLGYGLVFVGASVDKLRANASLAAVAEKAAPAETELSKRLAGFAASCKVLGGECSSVRMFIRLFGLLKIYAGLKSTYANPPKDGVLKVLAYGQLAAMSGYLALENHYYLWAKGIVSGAAPAEMARRFRIAIWVFLGYILLDFVRLRRVSVLRQESIAASDGEKEDKIQLKAQDAAWWRSLQVDLAYFPLCFHWGVEGGLLADHWVGLGGAAAGFVGFREVLRQTAQ